MTGAYNGAMDQSTTRAQRLEDALVEAFSLDHLEVINESHGHNVPANSETHFKVVLVSPDFEGVARLARHRQVNDAAKDEFAAGLHALAVHTYTLEEWRKRHQDAPLSPPCAGGDGGRG